ncbi:hypothetical protein Ssi03_54000 [Sphaerisporangium siamense]|uniref:Uncharacterized protein n=1 Tax=Sphaerisporangium siamense TaxID=795645 RepID=A0A7W7D6J6_9ACTN|nr:hypothetical protein [Sphaerisporangium siamense]MBB4701222.1 hypothetical protein [Sphaerisporangium siamense]GII87410.1 hypothetical protein Ssi03_54000 [Sphaerisporangium siamense]
MTEYIDLDALWKVLVAALLAGAGLVAVYSLALVGLANGRAAGRVAAGLCFLVVAAGLVLGLYVMLAK